MKFVTQDYYEILSVAPAATNEDVKRAYRLVRQSFRPDSLAIHSLYSEEETEAISAKIDEAFRILSDPELARRYAKYHRTALPGRSIARDPEVFFDQVHDLEGPSPIEQLARHVGRLSEERRGVDRVVEEPMPISARRSMPPEPRFNRPPPDAELPPATNSMRELRPVAHGAEPFDGHEAHNDADEPGALEAPAARLLATPQRVEAQVAAALAAPELSFDSLEELPEDAIEEPMEASWSSVVVAQQVPRSTALPPASAVPAAPIMPPATPIARPMRPAARTSYEPTSQAETAPSVPLVSPRVDPTTLALPGAIVAPMSDQTTLASVAAVAQPTPGARRWGRDTVRKRAIGPLEVQPLDRAVVESIEMDCGGRGGAFLQACRREMDVSIKDISSRTRISVMTLRSIEADEISDLPAKVYLKGYLTQIARLLHLPVAVTVEGYFRANGMH